jgi:hypothetical protein
MASDNGERIQQLEGKKATNIVNKELLTRAILPLKMAF